MTKFISKCANLHIIIKPGIPAQPITGAHATPTISVKFQDGVANVEDEELIVKMKAHPGFNSDFISAEEEAPDPYAYMRSETEPTHVMHEMKYGQPVNRTAPPVKKELPIEIRKMVQDQATLIAKQMLPGMVKEVLGALAKESAGSKVEEIKPKVANPKVVAPKADLMSSTAAPELASTTITADKETGKAKDK